MRCPALLAFAASAVLALAACGDASGPSAEGTGEAAATETAAAATTARDATANATASADPDTPVSNAATPGATATPGASPSPAARPPRAVDRNPAGDACGASRVAPFVSLVATPAVRARLAAKVGHDRIRWVGPDTAVTEDYSPQRLNVALDRNEVITGGRCG